ncbi:FkbM family methyltransferase [Tateyamaria sp.]|uniref:FkbM family methyltransferase n=1 Tax=Tateyamaria sp. TaxID=1929288 RepID=UPI00329DA507
MSNLLRQFFRSRLIRWVEAVDGAAYVRRFETAKKVRPNIHTHVSHDGTHFIITDGDMHVHVARKSRLHFNILGIAQRRAQLKDEYLLRDGLLRPGDLVIDCGANIGEFSVICAIAGARVMAFEPDPTEFGALLANADGLGIQCFQRALWNENGEQTFYDSNDEGDSSLINPGDAAQSFSVQTQRLDAVTELPSGPIRLIKLEAEGAEPEILQGMGEVMDRVEYLTVDMGPERGLSKDNTVPAVSNALFDAGFRMEAFFPPRCTALFGRI